VISDALNFRREGIPCDVIGLEPGWMETNYDLSTEKEWSKERFPIPSYCQNGPHNFINAVKRMGFKLELWLCQEYDLSYEEERRLGAKLAGEEKEREAKFHQDAELDEHFSHPRYSDQITKKDEPWFEHLKKFVDQGVDFFKQDGAFHVCDHPDRLWGSKKLPKRSRWMVSRWARIDSSGMRVGKRLLYPLSIPMEQPSTWRFPES
jgi:alpha-glucosidase (family GH31 glycosyl hydrolase)